MKEFFKGLKDWCHQKMTPVTNWLRKFFGPLIRWHQRFFRPFYAWIRKTFGPFWHRFQINRWLIALFLSIILVVSVLGTFEAKTTDVSDLKKRLQSTTEIYDVSGNKAGSLSGQKGTYVKFSDISPHAVNAVIATEDRHFYQEHGFSIRGMTRGVLTTIWYRLRGSSVSVGGSTLTQQLVKNAFLSQDQTVTRKARELFLSIQVEKEYSKHDILAMYLNNAYFGHGVWGIQDAAEKYFGVSAANLSVSQSAMLIGMLQSPNGYDPLTYKDAAKQRRDQVLQNMVATKYLTQAQADYNAKLALGATNHEVDNSNYNYPYYFDSVINEAMSKYGLKEQDILDDGYKIYTTLNQKDQTNLQNDYADATLNPIGEGSQAASVVMDAKTGGVRAIIGGRGDHVFRGFNRATQSYRSPGSTIKPIVDYGPSLSRGFSYDSELKNSTMSFGTNGYSPSNYGNYTSEKIPMYKALENSYNIPAVWLLDQMGVNAGYNAAVKAGLPLTKSDKNLALAIGGLKKGVTPLQLTQAYTSFANGGEMSSSHFITKIVDASGKTIAQAKEKHTRLWSKRVANEMTSMMLGVYTHGTGVAADPTGYDVAGKTGTTEVSGTNSTSDNATDSWAIAYTPDVVVTTWTGYDETDASHTISAYLSQTAGPLMKTTLEQVLPNTAQTKFSVKSVRAKLSATEDAASNKKNGIANNISGIGDDIKNGASSAWSNVKDGAKKAWSGIQSLLPQ
ncbi:PBP1A family penicillin-binding protein [Weissella paramesenteroides]|uniref:Penicillin-binding protein, 1A family n=1 Tax=Weissella paramesenteroides ATCC 33313 TaxID=585506 RepID=C5RCI9_WEIPA|nr:PBP1A family penicillin-binding protein [Weissella paramesenteroides]ATF41445.1 penicillin-binding protein [Weissella paramesenteroides]EER74145.1 penicillin-binding protein, 1A family [Weissella paramesenteroides ATCC 33313]